MSIIIETFALGQESFMRWARLDATGKSKGCVVIGLGWGEWLEKYAPVMEEWSQKGFDSVAVEWRGQGLSSRFLDDRMRAWHGSLDTLVTDFDTFFNWYFEEDPGPVLLMGHSLGSHLLLRWYVEKAVTTIVKGVILISPMQQVNTEPFKPRIARLITETASLFGLGKHYAPGQSAFDPVNVPFAGNRLTRDEARFNAMILALRENGLLKSGGITFGWLNAAFRSAEKLEKRLAAGAPQGPYLLVAPSKDPLVETAAMKRIATLLPHCTTVFIDDAAHELLQETDDVRSKLWAAMDGFVKKTLG